MVLSNGVYMLATLASKGDKMELIFLPDCTKLLITLDEIKLILMK